MSSGLIKEKKTTHINSNPPIDVVILWVDGSDTNHQNKMRPFLSDKEKMSEKKFRTRFDQVNEIQYTIESILKYATYIRRIFIVTDNQSPEFIKNNPNRYPKVSIIDHKVIFEGHHDVLPTFNCRSIETCIYRIPDLSEHFIYFNDDFCLINPTTISDFFVDGKPVLRGSWQSFDEDRFIKSLKPKRYGHKHAQQLSAKLVGLKRYYNFKHTPHPMRKSTFELFFSKNNNVFRNNIKHRFRSINQFTPQGLANHLEIKNKSCILKKKRSLLYFRSYKKPLLWYTIKLNLFSKRKLFFASQSLDLCPPKKRQYILDWLQNRIHQSI